MSTADGGNSALGKCLTCFKKIEKYVLLPHQESQKIVNNCLTFLHEAIVKSKLEKSVKSHNESEIPLCKKCWDAAVELTQLTEQLTNFHKEIADKKIGFSFAVLFRRNQVEDGNKLHDGGNTSSEAAAQFILLNVTGISPSLFSEQTLSPLSNSEDEYPSVNNLDFGMNTFDDVTFKTEIVKQEYNGENNSTMSFNDFNDPVQVLNQVNSQLAKEGNQDSFKSKTARINLSKSKETDEGIESVTSAKGDGFDSASGPVLVITTATTKDRKELSSKVSLKRSKETDVSKLVSKKNINKDLLSATTGIGNREHSIGESSLTNKSGNGKSILGKKDNQLTHKIRSSHSEQSFRSTASIKTRKICLCEKRKYKCPKCNKVFECSTNLEIHLRGHTDGNQFKCSFCEKAFSQLENVKRHEMIHTVEKPFKCSFCEKAFDGMDYLKCHEKVHAGEKRFRCITCSQTFKKRSVLLIHERIHTGEKQFKCSFCEKAFDRMDYLKCHERAHAGEKRFRCITCSQTFKKRSALLYHERIHTGEKPFSCPFCPKTFVSSSGLRVHERIHTGEKPFNCSFCSKTFVSSSNLRVHERIHTGEKPFECSFCGKGFSRLDFSKRHEKTHTKASSFPS